jgi:predicted nucleic acid-binding protein
VRRIRVYVDTSVFGGVHDVEFAEISERFFEQVRRGAFVVLLSRLTTDELEDAPAEVSRVIRGLSPEQVEPVPLNEEVRNLAEEYIKAGVLGEGSIDDATHVAAATVAGADLILSWNFRHIVNFQRICGFNSVNARHGYRSMVILSPREVLDDD